MNKFPKPSRFFVIACFFWLGLIAACSSEPVRVTAVAERPTLQPTLINSPQNTATPLPTTTPSYTPTMTIVATATPVPTTTPFLTVTAMPTVDIKTVFLEYSSGGGDGGSETDVYYGRDTPNVVIYTDGQVIISERKENDRYFLEAWASTDEMCNLLAQLIDTGFFSTYDPIYAFDETTQYSDGAGYGIMIANGPLPQRWDFYGPYRDYLIPPLKQSYELFKNYRPDGATYYIPERLILWVEADADSPAESANIAPWPEALPPITQLWQDPLNHEVLVEGEAVAAIMTLFDYRLASKRFVDEGVQYEIILRPLLPNENPYPTLGFYGTYTQTFNLPFDCPTIDLPTVEPAATAVPVESILVPDLAGKGRLLFSSNQSGNNDVYMINADGTDKLNLTNHVADDEMAALSPDEQKIAFVSNRDGNDEIYLMNPDGTNVTRLTHSPEREIAPTWSPDGKQIIFMSNRLGDWQDEKWQLFVIDIETGIETQFADTMIAEGMYAPDWSPDGEHVLFSSGVQEIFVMDEHGENEVPLARGNGAVWSPDGKRIAYLDNRTTGLYKLFMMNADGTQSQNLANWNMPLRGFAWSPDGKHLAFTSSASDKYFIYILNVEDNAEPVLLVRNASVSDWIP